MSERLAICGAGGHAKVVADIVRRVGIYEVTAFLDDVDPAKHGTQFCGARVIGGDLAGSLRNLGLENVIVAFGDNARRWELSARLKGQGVRLVNAIHPRAVLADDIEVDDGTVIMAGAVVNPGARIASCVVINTGATVDHDCIVHDGASLCPGVHLGGHVEVGAGAWVGIGATVRDRVRIGAGSVVGAGAVVVKHVPPGVVVVGVPARVVRSVRHES